MCREPPSGLLYVLLKPFVIFPEVQLVVDHQECCRIADRVTKFHNMAVLVMSHTLECLSAGIDKCLRGALPCQCVYMCQLLFHLFACQFLAIPEALDGHARRGILNAVFPGCIIRPDTHQLNIIDKWQFQSFPGDPETIYLI